MNAICSFVNIDGVVFVLVEVYTKSMSNDYD